MLTYDTPFWPKFDAESEYLLNIGWKRLDFEINPENRVKLGFIKNQLQSIWPYDVPFVSKCKWVCNKKLWKDRNSRSAPKPGKNGFFFLEIARIFNF